MPRDNDLKGNEEARVTRDYLQNVKLYTFFI